MMTTEKNGRGLLGVSSLLWEDLHCPSDEEAWKKALMLPDDYTIEAINRRERGNRWDHFELIIESEHIPVSDGPLQGTIVNPFYCREGNTAILDRIEISLWDGEHWQTSNHVLPEKPSREMGG